MPPLYAEFMRFALVGGFTALIFFGLVTTLALVNVTSPWVTAMAYMFAVSFQYVAHAKFTFGTHARQASQLLRFLVVNAFGLAYSVLVIDILAPLLLISRPIAAFTVVATLPIMNYATFKLWAFAGQNPKVNDGHNREKKMVHVYTDTFFSYIEQGSFRSAREVAPILVEALSPSNLLDVGCGRGAWAKVWGEAGVANVYGVDGEYIDTTKLHIDPDYFIKRDLANPFDLDRRFDLVTTLEVAEHLPRDASAGFVESLVRHSDQVLFSAATPGQGGERHINERPLEFWRALFADHGYVPFDFVRPRISNDARIEPWYRYNTILYVRSSAIAALPGAVRDAEVPDDVTLPDRSPVTWRLRRAIVRLLPRPIVDWIAVANAHQKAKGARNNAL